MWLNETLVISKTDKTAKSKSILLRTVRIPIMANISQNQRGRYNNLSEEKLEAELNKVNPDVKVIYTARLYQCSVPRPTYFIEGK